MSIVTERIDNLTHIYSNRNKMLRDNNGNMVSEVWTPDGTIDPNNYVETEFPVPEHEEIDEEA